MGVRFEKTYVRYILMSTIAWLIFGSIAIFINVIASEEIKYAAADKSCATEKDKFFEHSMINIWIVTDLLICLISMPCVVLNYYTDKTAWYNKWKTTILNTKKNALKKFYLNNPTAKETKDSRSLESKLVKRIMVK